MTNDQEILEAEFPIEGIAVQVGKEGHSQTVHLTLRALLASPLLQELGKGAHLPDVSASAFTAIARYLDNGDTGFQPIIRSSRPLLGYAKAWILAGQLGLPAVQNSITSAYRDYYIRQANHGHQPRMEAVAFKYLRDTVGRATLPERFLINLYAGLFRLPAEYFSYVRGIDTLPVEVARMTMAVIDRVQYGGIEYIVNEPERFQIPINGRGHPHAKDAVGLCNRLTLTINYVARAEIAQAPAGQPLLEDSAPTIQSRIEEPPSTVLPPDHARARRYGGDAVRSQVPVSSRAASTHSGSVASAMRGQQAQASMGGFGARSTANESIRSYNQQAAQSGGNGAGSSAVPGRSQSVPFMTSVARSGAPGLVVGSMQGRQQAPMDSNGARSTTSSIRPHNTPSNMGPPPAPTSVAAAIRRAQAQPPFPEQLRPQDSVSNRGTSSVSGYTKRSSHRAAATGVRVAPQSSARLTKEALSVQDSGRATYGSSDGNGRRRN